MKRPTNLREFRKRKLREEQNAASAARRAQEGETKAERNARAKREALQRRIVDGAKREPGDAGGG